ncbi:MAG: SDR family oxidoreductase [Bacteroidales bacterium]
MLYFSNKTIWITGASSGIGKETALQLSRIKDVRLIISSRNEKKLQLVQQDCITNGARCEVLTLDLEQTNTLKEKAFKALDIFKGIDILIHNGGISQRSAVIETPIENDRKIMEIDYFSSVILTKTILPHMVEKKSGHIVVVSSISGCFGFPLRSAYCAAKHAMYGFYESLDIEIRKHGIPVTIVSPGRIQTNISYSALTKEGKAHGKMDEGQANGMPVETCVRKMLKAIQKKKHEILIGNKEVLMVHFYRKIPALFHAIAKNIKPT